MTESNTQAASPWLGLAEAVEVLGVHESTVRRWADRGAIKTIRTPGNQRRFSRNDCERIARDGYVETEAGHAAPQLLARVALVLASTLAFGTALAVATTRPLLVLSLLASVLVVGALGVLVAAAAAVVPEVLGALVDEARIRHRAGMARLRDDAARRHPAAS